jgi:hypothetical protein
MPQGSQGTAPTQNGRGLGLALQNRTESLDVCAVISIERGIFFKPQPSG